MLHHLSLLISKFVNFGRYAVDLYHDAIRMIEVGLCRLQGSPRSFEKRYMEKPSSGKLIGPRGMRTGRQERPLLIHYHIFKNAGTSFEWALEQALGNGFRQFDSSSPGGSLSTQDIVRYVAINPHVQAISSHQAPPPAPKIRGRDVVTSILIRDPIARIRSVYAFERDQSASSPGAIKAKELDFKGYVEWRLGVTPWVICNFQVYFCSGMKDSLCPIDEVDLQTAIANLDGIDLVGTVERYDEWLALAQFVLSKPFQNISLPVVRRNVSAPGLDPSKAAILDDLATDLGQTLAQQLLTQNELDMCLFRVADAILTRRLAERGVGTALLEANASAQKDRWLTSGDVSSLAP